MPDDEDEPLQNFWRCLEAMTDGKTLKRRRAWRKAYLELQGARKEFNRKGMTKTLNGYPALSFPPALHGFPMSAANRYAFRVPLHRLTAPLTTAACRR